MTGFKKYHLRASGCGILSLLAPFRANRCRIRLTFLEDARDFPGRANDRYYTVDLEPDVRSVICAIQQLRRWLVDRKAAAEEDLADGGRYRTGDNVYRRATEE